jgi:protein tyrosine phosphatase (PTP) superfamily phosphohydrolase (DUF442 family)
MSSPVGNPQQSNYKPQSRRASRTAINLATHQAGESLKNEAILVRSLGMNYYHIPVEWENPQLSNFVAFEQVIDEVSTSKTFIHCAANFRLTAFYSLYAMKNLNWTESQAQHQLGINKPRQIKWGDQTLGLFF